MKWVKDQKVEANLRSLGIKFEIEKVNVADIDKAEGIRRQARLIGKLKDDDVIIYAEGMIKPEAAWPMIIVQKPPHGKGRLWVWSGNHRLEAFTEYAFPEEKVIDAYVITLTDPLMIDVLPRVVNAWESSLGFSKEERIANAKYLVEQHSMRVDEAAALFGIKIEQIYVAKRQEDVKALISDMGININGIAKSLLTKMSPLMKNENVLKQTAKFLVTNRVKGDDAKQLIEDVKAERTELGQIKELARWEQIIHARNGQTKVKAKVEDPTNSRKGETTVIVNKVKSTAPKFSRTIRDTVLKNITNLAKVLSRCDTLEKLQCTDEADRETLARSWVIISKCMTNIQSQKGGDK